METTPPIPRQPAERTLVVAITVLVVVAVAQILGAAFALLPRVSLDFASRFSSASRSTASPVAPQTPAASAEAPSEQVVNEANVFLGQAENSMKQEDWAAALDAFAQADHIMPDNHIVLFRMGQMNALLGNKVEATNLYQRVLSLPLDSSDPIYTEVQQAARNELAMGGNPAAPASPGAAAPNSNRMRDEVGIPIGSVLGVIDCRVSDAPGVKSLKVATKASSAETIDPSQLKVVVYFYEQNDRGEVLSSDTRLTSDWISPPVDWGNGEPELLDIKYPLPAQDRGDLPPLQYYGYVLGIYYKGELQDSRAEPVSLLDEFPLKLYVSETSQ